MLKDASATALYGTRAANGVIVITTKKVRSDLLQFPTLFTGKFISSSKIYGSGGECDELQRTYGFFP